MWCYGNSVIWHVYIAISWLIAVEVKTGEANEAPGHNTLHFKSAGELRVNASCPESREGEKFITVPKKTPIQIVTEKGNGFETHKSQTICSSDYYF